MTESDDEQNMRTGVDGTVVPASAALSGVKSSINKWSEVVCGHRIARSVPMATSGVRSSLNTARFLTIRREDDFQYHTPFRSIARTTYRPALDQ
jgi:hypothetical protein